MQDMVLIKGKDIDGKVKTLEKSQPYQLELFHCLLPDEDRYSNTIELYDALPRFFPSTKKMAELREGGKFLNTLERKFSFKKTAYHLELRPGRIRTKAGTDIEYYPSEREQFVEEALWKLAHDKMRGCYLDKMIGVEFTLYELRQELARRGHAIKFPALIDSLTILNRCNVTLRNESGQTVFSSAIFPELLISSRADWLKNPKQAKCYVQFNKLATQSLRKLDYRLFDYVKFMGIDSMLGRWLFKRIAHNFTQAKYMGNSYTIHASTIIQDSGLLGFNLMRQNFQAIDAALEELKSKQIISFFKKTIVPDSHDRRKIANISYEIMPSRDFCDTTVLANQRQNELTAQATDAQKIATIRDNNTLTLEVLDR